MCRTLCTAAFALSVCFAILAPADAQVAPPPPSTPASEAPALQPEQLDQMLAPLALYPDALLSQIFMASTYPLEIVQADRWVKANPGLKGDALTAALEQQTWDPSVKSLVNVPAVLASLSDNLDWTVKIGNAFLADQKAVMDTVQRLRAKAQEAGNLKSSQELTVATEPAPAGSATPQIIVIQSPDPQVVYVPIYNPMTVYGPWWYYAYPPPIYYCPPGYVFGTGIGFGAGFVCGAAWGYAWGGCNWRYGRVDVDIHRNVNINARIDRNRYVTQYSKMQPLGSGAWQHDPSHRKGIEYPNAVTAKEFGGVSRAQAAQTRDAYRGRPEIGRQDIPASPPVGRVNSPSRVNAPVQISPPGRGDRPSPAAPSQNAAPSRDVNRSATFDRAQVSDPRTAFGDANMGSNARIDSSRGSASRGAAQPGGSGGVGGGGRVSGGGSGGGMGGGGGGRGR